MLRVTQNRGGRALLDDTPGVHHHNVLGHLRDNPEIVGNQHHRHPVGPRLVAQQAQDLRLHGDVGAVVGSSAISSFGWQLSAMAIITRCSMPPES